MRAPLDGLYELCDALRAVRQPNVASNHLAAFIQVFTCFLNVFSLRPFATRIMRASWLNLLRPTGSAAFLTSSRSAKLPEAM